MTASLIISAIVALLKAVPALEGIFSRALSLLAAQRAAAAVARKAEKDAAVDLAIDGHATTTDNSAAVSEAEEPQK